MTKKKPVARKPIKIKGSTLKAEITKSVMINSDIWEQLARRHFNNMTVWNYTHGIFLINLTHEIEE